MIQVQDMQVSPVDPARLVARQLCVRSISDALYFPVTLFLTQLTLIISLCDPGTGHAGQLS